MITSFAERERRLMQKAKNWRISQRRTFVIQELVLLQAKRPKERQTINSYSVRRISFKSVNACLNAYLSLVAVPEVGKIENRVSTKRTDWSRLRERSAAVPIY